MGAWAKDQGIDDNDKRFSVRYVARAESKITLLADTRGELANALDLAIDAPPQNHDLGKGRLKRFASFWDDGTLAVLNVSEGPVGADGFHEDAAGDGDPSATLAENFVPLIP
mmetsp:Transcript_15811/g.47160  ORF Transcript_15811/g.47160 Transcript_15811/m.47160 type:complete len:112 (+) Transcript_15811:416-751(+)